MRAFRANASARVSTLSGRSSSLFEARAVISLRSGPARITSAERRSPDRNEHRAEAAEAHGGGALKTPSRGRETMNNRRLSAVSTLRTLSSRLGSARVATKHWSSSRRSRSNTSAHDVRHQTRAAHESCPPIRAGAWPDDPRLLDEDRQDRARPTVMRYPNYMPSRWAAKQQEVVIQGGVPAEAIRPLW